MSQDDLAAVLGVSKASVSDWERGRMNPRVEQLPELRRHLMVSLDHLVCGDARLDVVKQMFGVQEPGPPGYIPAPDVNTALRANAVRGLFVALTEPQQEALIELMKTMRVSATAE